jgi:hypothetical protein
LKIQGTFFLQLVQQQRCLGHRYAKTGYIGHCGVLRSVGNKKPQAVAFTYRPDRVLLLSVDFNRPFRKIETSRGTLIGFSKAVRTTFGKAAIYKYFSIITIKGLK